MNDIPKERALGVFVDELVYLEACLAADPETEHVVQEVSKELALLDQKLQDERDIHRQGVLNRAKVKMKLQRAEDYIRDVYAATLFEVRQDRKDTIYQKLFKYDQASVLRMAPQAQLQEVMRMKNVLALAIYEDDFRDAQNEVLDKAIAEINGALELRAQLEERQMHHRLEVEQCKDSANNVRGRVHGELTKISRTKKNSKAWARGFFPEGKTTKKLSAEEIAKKNEAKAKRAADKAALISGVATERLRKAEAKTKLEGDKANLIAKSKADLEEATRAEEAAKEKIRLQLKKDLLEEIAREAREAELARLELEQAEEQARRERELNGGGDHAQF